ncbi:hypothetical protein [Janthinobacterium sp. Ant5-2-1]|uniref:hypothetical protein n=1 Tax=Janthinobacterium sp. Ant5-2-1 TaxID=1755239 RepID=UPI00128FA366|nr:hypothetical protein [Janthinobacterium sp. Ant5-2-1]
MSTAHVFYSPIFGTHYAMCVPLEFAVARQIVTSADIRSISHLEYIAPSTVRTARAEFIQRYNGIDNMLNTLPLAAPNGANLQVTSLTTIPAKFIFDRYAQNIIGGNRHIYDTLEVHGVRSYETGFDDATHYEIDNLNPTTFSVYIRLKGEGVECVGDFTRYADAVQYGTELSAQYSWPMRNFVLDRFRMTTIAKLQ